MAELENKYIGTRIDVLDHGHVTLVDFMASDAAICQAARVSYGKGTKSLNDDRALIRYCMRHRHTSPFEQCIFKFHWKLPIFVARQVIRHRTSSVNELSGRYSELKEEFYIPDFNRMKKQSTSNKQGSDNHLIDDSEIAIKEIEAVLEKAFKTYQYLLSTGLSREIARTILPVNIYTEWYWKMDLHNLFHFLKLRMDSHSQEETQQYAKAIYQLIQPIVPEACGAFEDYVLNATTFSAQEMKILRGIIKEERNGDLIDKFDYKDMSKREIKEFIQKIK
jgi:thymidylate synthase (FAD)